MNSYFDQIVDTIPKRQNQRPEPLNSTEISELLEQNKRWGNSRKALENIRALSEADTFVAITGQQAGIFTGPLYTIYKAVAAIQLAEKISAESGLKVVPVFWIASEDHDFDEIRWVNWIDKEGKIFKKNYEPDLDYERQSIFQVPVEDFLKAWIDELETETLPSENKNVVIEFLRVALGQSENLEDFFARIFARLFGEKGLVLVTPRMNFIRERGKEIIQKELSKPGHTSGLVNQTEVDQKVLHRLPEDINAFYYDDEFRRLNLKVSGKNISVGDQYSKSTDELIEELNLNPQRFSYNVVVRPVVQDFIFPNLTYIGGPGEQAYFKQLDAVYEFFDVPMPVIYPRPSAVLIEPRIRRALEKLQLSADDYLTLSNDQIRSRIAKILEEKSIGAFEKNISEFEKSIEQLNDLLNDSSPEVKRSLKIFSRKVNVGKEKLRERFEFEVLQRSNSLDASDLGIEQVLKPDGKPQERFLNIVSPFLLKAGWGLIDQLCNELEHKEEMNIIEI